MKAEFAFFCSRGTVGRTVRDHVDAVGAGMDVIVAPQFPHPSQVLNVALRICGTAADDGDHRLHARILDSNGKDIYPATHSHIDLRLGRDIYLDRACGAAVVDLGTVGGLAYPGPGEYHVLLTVDESDDVLVDLPLYLVERRRGS
jgi:hypothetical protein